MKTKSLLIALFIFITGSSFGQNTKHSISSGKIIFDITYPESKMDDDKVAQLPKESVMHFKNDMVKVEVSMGYGSTIIISNNSTKESTMLMDLPGNKWAIKMSKDEIEKEKGLNAKPKVELTRESKVIAGYSCMKAIITVTTKSGDKSFDVWYTNELKAKNSFATQIEGINGFMMEFNSSQNGMNMKMTARSVEPMEIADSEFSVPDGYTYKTMDELKNYGKTGK